MIFDGENNFMQNKCNNWMKIETHYPITKMPIWDSLIAHVVSVTRLQARFAIYLLDTLAKLKVDRKISTNTSIWLIL